MTQYTVGHLDQFDTDVPTRVEIDGADPVCVVRRSDTVRVFADRCPHARCVLSDGVVEGDDIECPCHGGLFSLLDGAALAGPTQKPIEFLAVDIIGDELRVGNQA